MIGIHLPNADISVNELDHIISLGCHDYVLYVSAFDSVAFSKYNAILARFAQASQGSATIRVHCRIEARGPLDALFDSRRLELVYDQLGGKIYSICIRNEPNIESPNTATTYRNYVRDLIKNTPSDILPKLALAPISPGRPGYLDYVNAGISVSSPLKKHHIHAYGSPQEAEVLFQTMRGLWPHEIICTEHNFGAGRKYVLQKWADELPGVLTSAKQNNIQSVNVFIWRWATPDMSLPTPVNIVGTPMEDAIKQVNFPSVPILPIAFKNYFSPNHDGPRAKTTLLVMHATRGGQDDYEREFDGTLQWFSTSASDASSHVVISPTRVSYPIHDEVIGWHAGHKTDESLSLNPISLGIELCQGRAGMAIPTNEYKLAVVEASKLVTKYKIPLVHNITSGICEHWETPAGASYGKSDIKFPFLIDQFIRDISIALGGIDWSKIYAYADWSLARIANRQDPRIITDFIEHLKALGADYSHPHDYGLP